MRLPVLTVLLGFALAPFSPLGALVPTSTWESFGREQGLSGSSVTGVVQDQTGYLWISTQTGLNRWDGYTMRVWQKEPFSKNTLSHNLIQTMTLDGGNLLWLGTYGGLDRFDTVTETFRSFRHQTEDPRSLSHNVVTRVYRDRQGTLWVGTLDGLNRMVESSGTFDRFPFVEGASTGLSGKTVRSFVEDDQGRLWVGTSGGLDLYEARTNQLLPFAQVFPDQSLPKGAVMGAVRVEGSSALWLAIWGQGLVELDPTNGNTRVYPLSDNRLFGLNPGEKGFLHVGTWGGGLVVFEPQTGRSFGFRHDPAVPDSLAHDVVYGTFQDRGGLVWVATNGGGLSRFNPRRQQYASWPATGKVLVLHESQAGAVWAGVYNGGLVQYGPEGPARTWKHDPRDPRSLSNDILNSITEDKRGRLWMGTNAGVSILDPATGKISRWSTDPLAADSLPDEVVTSLAIDRTEAFWFGTYRSGVVRRPEPGLPGPVQHYTADPTRPGSLPDNFVYFVQEDRKGRIWVGTNGGLALYRPGTDDFRVWTNDPENPRTLPSNTVRAMLEDSRDRLWVVTNGGGLSLLDPDQGTLRNFGLSDGLSNLSVFSIVEDPKGRLWLTSANGLFSLDPDTFAFHRYGLADGLTATEFSSGNLAARDGRVLFGGLSGVLVLQPDRDDVVEAPPSVAVTGIHVLGLPRPVAPSLKLGWQENAVTFSFAALDFRNPTKNQYAYRLDGFDRDWIQSGNRHEVTYTNLWPGTYRFHVKGANPSDAWAEAPQALVLEVEAAPWAAWYAWIAYGALFLFMVYLYQRAKISQSLGRKVSELEVLRAQLEAANLQLDHLARLDGLTGIPNRRALDEWLTDEWARAHRQHQSVAILMLDIDDFKRYNDFYGHLEGDTCLKAVAHTLVAHILRTSDFCARYGGEEFVVILHDTDLEGGRIVAERLREAIDNLAIPHQMGTAKASVTVSLGVAAEVPDGSGTVSALLQKADQALYRAKALGRHRVETA